MTPNDTEGNSRSEAPDWAAILDFDAPVVPVDALAGVLHAEGRAWLDHPSERRRHLAEQMCASPRSVELWRELLKFYWPTAPEKAALLAKAISESRPGDLAAFADYNELLLQSNHAAEAERTLMAEPQRDAADRLQFLLGLSQLLQRKLDAAWESSGRLTGYASTQPEYFTHQLTEMLARAERVRDLLEGGDAFAWHWVHTGGMLLEEAPADAGILDEWAIARVLAAAEHCLRRLEVPFKRVLYATGSGESTFARLLAAQLGLGCDAWDAARMDGITARARRSPGEVPLLFPDERRCPSLGFSLVSDARVWYPLCDVMTGFLGGHRLPVAFERELNAAKLEAVRDEFAVIRGMMAEAGEGNVAPGLDEVMGRIGRDFLKLRGMAWMRAQWPTER